MGKGQIILSAAVGFVILATLGFSQEVFADHQYVELLEKWSTLHAAFPECSDELKYSNQDSNFPWMVMDINFITHEKCVYKLLDDVVLNAHNYNYGTIVIDPYKVTVINSGTIENHGTIILRPIPEVEVKEKRDSDYATLPIIETLFSDKQQRESEIYQAEQERLEKFKNFVNEGTIINYGLVVIDGEMISTGDIINKRDGKIQVNNYLYSSGLITNGNEPEIPTDKFEFIHTWPATIVNNGNLAITKTVDNWGAFANYNTFNGKVRNLCGGYAFGVTVTAIECQPYFWSPADGASFSEFEEPIISWTAAEGSIFSKDTSTYNFWISPKDSLEVILSAKKISNTYFIVKDLPVGEYDYYVNAIHSDESESGFDRQGLTIKPSMFDEMELVEIDKVMCSNFSLESNGPLNLSDIVIFTDDGEKQEKAYARPESPSSPSSCTHTTLSYLILINPNGENEINWDPISYQLGSGDELYSTTFSGNCDGINLLPKSEEFWNCTITFNQISEPVYPDIPPQTTADSDSDGILDSFDNCPAIYNPDQEDSDGDGIGDACDSVEMVEPTEEQAPQTTADSDSDGILDSFDNCPTIYNPDQEDSDGDGIGDACDSVEMVEPTEEQAPQTTADSDSDGILDSFDNCPTIFNSDQADSNGDGIGDVCEPVETTDDTVPGSTDDSTDGTAKQKQERGPGGPQQQAFTPSGNYLPPIKQMKMGVSSQEILCNEGMELIFKSSDGSPKCVSSIAAEKLVARGWATR